MSKQQVKEALDEICKIVASNQSGCACDDSEELKEHPTCAACEISKKARTAYNKGIAALSKCSNKKE